MPRPSQVVRGELEAEVYQPEVTDPGELATRARAAGVVGRAMELHPQQVKFALSYVEHGDAKLAVADAGYKVSVRNPAAAVARRLLKSEKVRSLIYAMRRDAAQAGTMTREKVMSMFLDLRAETDDDQVKFACIQAVGKICGYYHHAPKLPIADADADIVKAPKIVFTVPDNGRYGDSGAGK